VAREAQRLWAGQPIPPLLTSFKREALRGAQAVAPELPRGLLMHELAADWHEAVDALQCMAVACHFPLYNDSLLEEIKRLGLYSLAYTVNDLVTAHTLLKMGVDSIITDTMNKN
jgi:glycerophosphoryl diester phosphodiesterase